MASLPSLQPATPTFLGIPAEIRFKIYGYVFEDAKLQVDAHFPSTDRSSTYSLRTRMRGDGLLFVSQQISEESRSIFRKEATVHAGMHVFQQFSINKTFRDALIAGRQIVVGRHCYDSGGLRILKLVDGTICINPWQQQGKQTIDRLFLDKYFKDPLSTSISEYRRMEDKAYDVFVRNALSAWNDRPRVEEHTRTMLTIDYGHGKRFERVEGYHMEEVFAWDYQKGVWKKEESRIINEQLEELEPFEEVPMSVEEGAERARAWQSLMERAQHSWDDEHSDRDVESSDEDDEFAE